MNIHTLDNLNIENANTLIKEFSNSNPNLRKCSPIFNFKETGTKIYFLVKLALAYYESEI